MPLRWLPPPCVVHEDAHVLVVRKPAGWNTHAPATFSGEGIYEWLRDREPRWATLAIIHRLDKDTSGLIVFGKTPLGNRSLTQQFTDRKVTKTYLLWSANRPPREQITSISTLVRRGSYYESVPHFGSAALAETRFEIVGRDRYWIIRAHPKTGRTHQIRVHAAQEGFPILGDELYGGPHWDRMCLHAESLAFDNPVTGARMEFKWPADFTASNESQRRQAIIHPEETDAFRSVHGAADGCADWFVDRLGVWEIAQSELDDPTIKTPAPPYSVSAGMNLAPSGRYFKNLNRNVGTTQPAQVQPGLIWGREAPEPLNIRENGVRFELSFREGYSIGLFLDQRDNRRRLLNRHVAAGFPLDFPDSKEQPTLLNAFSYTCGFSLGGALGGFRVTSLDLSKKYLEWGRRNFVANEVAPGEHDWIFGDVFDRFKRFAKKGRQFDLVMLDPPTFSRSKESGTFNAETGYGKLVYMAASLVAPGGVLFASANASRLEPDRFCDTVRAGLDEAGRKIASEYFAPQPPDFPITPDAPGYLKTLWLRLDRATATAPNAEIDTTDLFE